MKILAKIILIMAVTHCIVKVYEVDGTFDFDSGIFSVSPDEYSTEMKAYDYAKYLKSFSETSKELLRKLMQKRHKSKGICGASFLGKLYVCDRTIRMEYYSLNFLIKDDDRLKCGLQIISYRYRDSRKHESDSIPMYACPLLQYRSLETNELTTLPIRYYISETQNAEDEFLFYVQDGPNHPIYPHKFVSNVMISLLEVQYSNWDIPTTNKLPTLSIILLSEASVVNRKLQKLADMIKSKSVYEKFTNAYRNVCVCGLPRAHKISVCRDTVRKRYTKVLVDHRGYDEFDCRKREVHAHEKTTNPEQTRSFKVSTLKCPPLYREYLGGHRFRFKAIFLSPSFDKLSFLIYIRFNIVEEKITADSFVHYPDFTALKLDQRRNRELIRPHEFRKQIYDAERSSVGPSRSQSQQLPQVQPSIVTFERSIIEDNTIDFVQVMRIKNPYDHLVLTSNTISVNMLLSVEMFGLCYQVLNDPSFGLSFDHEADNGSFVARTLIDIKLVMRNVELLPRETINSRKCPPVRNNSNQYFLTGSIEKKAVILYVKYEKGHYAIPYAFAHPIDTKRLQFIRNELKLLPL